MVKRIHLGTGKKNNLFAIAEATLDKPYDPGVAGGGGSRWACRYCSATCRVGRCSGGGGRPRVW